MQTKATNPGADTKPGAGAELGVARVPLNALKPYPGNPRRGNVEAIKESLKTNGLFRPIVVNRRTNEVLAGNHTMQAAKELGWSEIAVTYVDVDDEKAARIVLADNRTNDLADYDSAALAELLQELPELEGTGYDRDDLDALLAELGEEERGEDEPAPLPASSTTRPGELFELGAHRLLCGDAREASPYRTLLGTDRAALLWTDPPYGVEYEGKTERRLRIQGDGTAELAALLSESFARIDAALTPGSPLYLAHPGGERSLAFLQAFLAAGWSLRQTLVCKGRDRPRPPRLPLRTRAAALWVQAGRGAPRPRRPGLARRRCPIERALLRSASGGARAPDYEATGADRALPAQLLAAGGAGARSLRRLGLDPGGL